MQAASASVAGLAAAAGASLLFANSGNLVYMLASPWLLYYGYQTFGRDLTSLGGGLSARQNFKRQLEIATVNPRDADAHYQLGLVYVQRRANSEAEASFRRALEIDPNEPDALFQLGSLLRKQPGREAEARTLLERGAQLDPKLASHQVWRELGAVALATGATTEALIHLDRYVNVREYDPEGLVLYGRALKATQKTAEAKAAFERAIEAVKTAPKFRKGELSPWEKQARQELKG
jgi:tetratricopeptide (TPR) repeat protein